jgi:type VI secretion system protein VasI
MVVMFSLPLAVNPNNKVDVEYQINEGDLVKEVWNSIPDQRGIFSPRPIPLLRDMIKARKIGFRVDYQSREHKIETFFELDGLTEAIKPIQSACNWK